MLVHQFSQWPLTAVLGYYCSQWPPMLWHHSSHWNQYGAPFLPITLDHLLLSLTTDAENFLLLLPAEAGAFFTATDSMELNTATDHQGKITTSTNYWYMGVYWVYHWPMMVHGCIMGVPLANDAGHFLIPLTTNAGIYFTTTSKAWAIYS